MHDEIRALRREVRTLKLYGGALTAAAVVGALAAFRPSAPEDQVLRARGLVIVDAAGRERILIGAPIPASAHRLRTDTARMRTTWAPRFGRDSARFMAQWYPALHHSVNGMLVLDAQGVDRLAVGDSVPDALAGRRVAAAAGVVLDDPRGMERSGYGLLTVAGRTRVVLGLDGARGGEALALVVEDSGAAGVLVPGPRDTLLFFGRAPASSPVTRLPAPVRGVLWKEGTRTRLLDGAPPPP